MLAGTEPRAQRRRWHVAVWPLLGAALLTAPAAAAVPRAEVNVHGSAEESQQLEATLRSLFPPDAQLSVTPIDALDAAQLMREPFTPTAEDVVARAWIELHDGSRVTIYVADRSGERILVRHLPRNTDDSELVREATARVVATALEALLSGAQIGVERKKAAAELAPPTLPAAAAASPAPPRAPASKLAFTLGAHYSVQLFSSQVPLLNGPGLLLGASDGAQPTRVGASLLGQVWWPSQADDDVARVRVYSGALRLLASVERSLSRVVDVNLGLGGGIDVTRVEPGATTSSASLRLASPRTLLTPALRAAFGSRFRMSAAFALYTTLALDVDPSRTRYVSLNDGAATELLSPHAWRPSLAVGVATP